MTDDRHADAPSSGSRNEGDGIAPRIVRPLRAAERVDSSFTARVMSAVHAETRGRDRATDSRAARRGAWWTRKRTIQLSPLGGLAMAAGIAGLAVLGATTRDKLLDPPSSAASFRPAVPDTVHVVRFVFIDRDAEAVSLVGDFNAWSKSTTPLVEETGDGTWVVALALPRGRHEYAFVVRRANEEQWAADPVAPPVRDEFGTESSVVTVGATHPARGAPTAS